jgi:cation diffusion facilitator CzcD-associated flavoprotein CzcO
MSTIMRGEDMTKLSVAIVGGGMGGLAAAAALHRAWLRRLE